MLQRHNDGNVIYLRECSKPRLVPHRRVAQAALIHLELYLMDIAPNMGKQEHDAIQTIRDFLETR